jgi:putative Mn2+ efflux pump MntP
MDLLTIFLIAAGLSMDAFAVSLSTGMALRCTAIDAFKLAFFFGFFQFLMPVIGWAGASRFSDLISSFDHWIAFGLLGFVGVRMIRSGLDAKGETHTKDPSRGGTMVMLSVATSIDAFAIGLTLAMLQVDILYPSVVIGVVTGILSLIGLLVGGRLGLAFGKRMEVIGGVLLIFIGFRVLLSHLLA